MILPFLLAFLAFVTLLAILAPLLRGSRPGLDRASYDQAVYRDQLQELDRDIARGLTTLDEAAASRLEIQRRLLAADRLTAASPSTTPRPPARAQTGLTRSPVLACVLFVLVAAGAVGVYLRLGAPGVPDEPFSSRQAEIAAMAAKQRLGMEAATEQLAAKLKADPSDPQAWLLYARALATLSRWDQAEDAYRHAMNLGAKVPDIAADHAEMLVLAAGGTVTPAAEAAFRQVLADDPGSGIARYYLAMAAIQTGEPRRAIDMLQALLADMPADSPLREQIGQRISEAALAAHIPVPALANGVSPSPGSDAGQAGSSADMPDEQRQAMIRSMVERLAAKQEANPGNLDGWLQLGRAYTVLHQPDKAADAYEKAAALKPADISIPLQEVRALLADHKPADKLPPRVVNLLQRVEAADPRDPMVLWFLGMAAMQDGHRDVARRYWETLLAQLPPGSSDARMIETALSALTVSNAAPPPMGSSSAVTGTNGGSRK
jgi:cytochrome c-type biogenesis protein CcmH